MASLVGYAAAQNFIQDLQEFPSSTDQRQSIATLTEDIDDATPPDL